MSIPVLDNLEASVAARFDSYDDFGEAFSPQVAARYNPFDMLVLRASWGEGFKAPNLTQLHRSRSQSFNDLIDSFRCAAIGIDPCPRSQVENFSGGNPDLNAENADSFNVGFVVEPLDGLSFSLDYYGIKIEDVVTSLSLGTLLRLEAESALPDGTAVRRGAPTQPGDPGRLVSIDNVFANLAVRDVKGYDLRANYVIDTDFGVLEFDLDVSRVDTWELTPSPGEDVVDIVGNEGNPQHRAVLSGRWGWGVYSAAYFLRVIDEFDGATTGTYERHFTHDITGSMLLPWGGEISGGILNALDQEPVIDSVNGYQDNVVLVLYPVAGRTPFLRYRHTF